MIKEKDCLEVLRSEMKCCENMYNLQIGADHLYYSQFMQITSYLYIALLISQRTRMFWKKK